MTQYVVRLEPGGLGVPDGNRAPRLTYRLAIPHCAGTEPPWGSVLWVLVRYRDADYLHARLEVSGRRPGGGPPGMILADLEGSTYYTAFPRLRVPSCAIRTPRSGGNTPGATFEVAAPALLDEIERVAHRCVPTLAAAGALDRAVSPLRQTFVHQKSGPSAFWLAWAELKRQIPACDLYRWRDLDPYVAAARALARCAESSKSERRGTKRRRAEIQTYPLLGLSERDIRVPLKDRHGGWCRRGDLERATARHQETLRSLCRAAATAQLQTAGSRLVDLVGRGNRRDVVFEVKTVSDLTWVDQARAALGQLLHYSFHYRAYLRQPILVAVFDQEPLNPAAVRARQFLEHYGVCVVWDTGGTFPALGRVVKAARGVRGR